MIRNIDVIDRIPGELQARLLADPYFVDIPVVIADKGNVKMEIDRQTAALQVKGNHRGIGVVVLQMVANDLYPDLALGPMRLLPSLQVVELVELNNDAQGTGKSGRQVARKIVQLIKTLRLVGLCSDFVPDDPAIIPVPLPDLSGQALRGYQVNFWCEEADDEQIIQCDMPLFAADDVNQVVSITCTTPGASIYYTLDDSPPSPTNGQIYSGTIPIGPVSITLRACAYLPPNIASAINRANISLTSNTP